MTENIILLQRAKQGDKKAEEELIINNMNLVYSIAGRFFGCGCEADDLTQIGAMGLVKAIHKFDPSFGVKLSTYAVPVIAGEIKRFLRDDGIIKISRSIKENAIKGRKCTEQLRLKLGREPTLDEISKESGIETGELLEAFEAVSPVETITPADKDGAVCEIQIPSEMNNEDKIINHVMIDDMLKRLNAREKQILILRYYKGKTQAETAKIIGVSQVQISRIEKRCIERLKEEFI